MKHIDVMTKIVSLLLLASLAVSAQDSSAQSPATLNASVPPLVNFAGVLTDSTGKPLSGVVGVTFCLYREQQGGVPLWVETQNIHPDKAGHYSVMLGATRSTGLPGDIFLAGEARWLGVQAESLPEQPRIMLLSVPYAMKAADAQTVGGLPPSAFVLAAPPNTDAAVASSSPVNSQTVAPAVSGTGTADYIPLWTSSTGALGNSALFQSGTGAAAKIGIATAVPSATLDVKGTATIRGALSLPAIGTATVNGGAGSRPLLLTASAFNSATGLAVNQTFQWQAEPSGNATGTPSGTLTLFFGQGGNTPASTGLRIASNGLITFARGQNLTATGVVSGSSFEIGGNLFASGSFSIGNSFVGFAGGSAADRPNTATGGDNTADGWNALPSDTTGYANTAIGSLTLLNNTTGYYNTAVGSVALTSNTTGIDNTATGYEALATNQTGTDNTAIGYQALFYSTVGPNTGVGSQALYRNTSGTHNLALGAQSLLSNTTGGSNVAAGDQALYTNTSGDFNIAIGYQTLYYNSSGQNNTAVGASALGGNQAGYENTGVGDHALVSNSSGTYLTCVGAFCNSNLIGQTNATAIGAYSMVAQSNSLVLGSVKGYNEAPSNVNVGIATVAPTNIFTIGQNAGAAIADGWSTYSSRRWKTNIQTLPNALNKVERLRGVTYNLKDSGKPEIGVIAEEVGTVVPEVVTYENNGRDARGVDYSRLTALLIEAVKQQQRQIQKQQRQIKRLTTKVEVLEATIHTTVSRPAPLLAAQK